MNEERLQEIKDSVDFQKQILMAHNMETLCVDEEQELIEEIERLNNDIKELLKENGNKEKVIKAQDSIIKEVREKLDTQLAFTSSYQLNYQSAMSIIEETKSILQGVDKN